MSTKKLVIFGTRHYPEGRIPAAIQKAMELIVDKLSPAIGLEEWSTKHSEKSAFSIVCDSKKIPWVSIGTPPTSELTTFDHSCALDFPMGANVQRHGPFEVQERREERMRTKIVEAMTPYESGLLVIGLAHLQSMCSKLMSDFDVRAYGYGLELF